MEILTAIGKRIPQGGFLYKNDIRVFEDGAVSLTYVDLRVIKEYGINHYPKSAELKKQPLWLKLVFKEHLQKHTLTPVRNIPERYKYSQISKKLSNGLAPNEIFPIIFVC